MNETRTPAAVNAEARRLTVLQSTGTPDDTTNPYLVLLLRALPHDVDVLYFSMRTALFASYDVFHVHWPEYLVRHRRPLTTLAKQACFAVLLARLWLLRVPVVRTLHNARAHEQGGWVERALLRGLDRLTRRSIRINAADDDTGADAGAPVDTILHGHYRDWYASHDVPPPVPGRLLCFGLIRPYKGIETLVSAFGALRDADATLRIVGNPVNPHMRQAMEQACATDARISARLEYVDDDVLAHEIGQACCVVLPYRHMQNSGALLLALSLGRPVLVPRNAVNVSLAAEVGPGWVKLYDDALDAAALADALRAPPPHDMQDPDLSRRDWPALGCQHYATYRAALSGGGA